MLRRAAATTTLNGRAAAWFRRLTRGPVTLPHLGRHHPQAQPQPARAVVSAPPLPHLCGARGYCYRRMARRIPIARPDGYSSSDGEAEDPDQEAEESTEGAEGDDDSEGSEVEGFMMDFSTFPGLGDGDRKGTEGREVARRDCAVGEPANPASSGDCEGTFARCSWKCR